MVMKLIGAILIIASCSSFGFRLSGDERREEAMLRSVIHSLNYMEAELKFHITALPELCRKAGKETGGQVGRTLIAVASELNNRVSPDAAGCMSHVLLQESAYPVRVRKLMNRLGHSLGVFDLPGQLAGLAEVRELGFRELEALERGKKERLRSYRTIGICAGLALAVLFI